MGKPFHIGTVLSITTGKLLSLDRMAGVYRILDYMTGESLYTHQLGRAAETCKPHLLEQFPQLDGAAMDRAIADLEKNLAACADPWPVINDWLRLMVDGKFGIQVAEELDVEPLSAGSYEHRNPLLELIEMCPDKPIVVIGGPNAA